MTDAPGIPRLGAIREALAARGRRPTRRFSQNFLTDPALLTSIVDAAGVEAGDVVLEVGPGPGALTAALLARGASVVAVEVDRVMAEVLRELLGEPAGLVLVEEDARAGGSAPSPATAAALDRAEAAAGRPGYRLAANLPYAIASPLLVDLLWNRPPVAGAVTVQLEVADRLVAAPGAREYGALSVLVGLRAEAWKVRRLPAGAFWPAPKVDSACVRLEARPDAAPDVPAARLRTAIDAVFRARRKRVANSILLALPERRREEVLEALDAAGIDPGRRGETLTQDEIVAFARALPPRAGDRP